MGGPARREIDPMCLAGLDLGHDERGGAVVELGEYAISDPSGEMSIPVHQ